MKEYLKTQLLKSIRELNEDGIYALSLFVYDVNDNPCQPSVTFGYNTEAQVIDAMEYHCPEDEAEARWNYAFWLQNKVFTFGMEEDTTAILKEWLETNGFPYYEDDDEAWKNDEVYDEIEDITTGFVSELVELVQEIHAEGILTEKFGKELPILIHELEYYDVIAEQNVRANGETIVKEFTDWIDDMYRRFS